MIERKFIKPLIGLTCLSVVIGLSENRGHSVVGNAIIDAEIYLFSKGASWGLNDYLPVPEKTTGEDNDQYASRLMNFVRAEDSNRRKLRWE